MCQQFSNSNRSNNNHNYYSFATVRDETDKLPVGVILVLLWQRDEDYQTVGGSASQWHAAAAQLAREMRGEVDPRIIWRNLFMQHNYDLCQRTLRAHQGKKGVLCVGPVAYSEAMRGRGLTATMADKVREMADRERLVVAFKVARPAFGLVELLRGRMPELEVADETRWSEEELEVGGEKVFKRLAALGGVKCVVSVPLSRADVRGLAPNFEQYP